MHCCQTAMEIDLEKHSVIHLASVLTIWSIDLPKLKTRHAIEWVHTHSQRTWTSERGPHWAIRPVELVVLKWRVPAINNRTAVFGSNWRVNEQCQLRGSWEVRSLQAIGGRGLSLGPPLGCSGDWYEKGDGGWRLEFLPFFFPRSLPVCQMKLVA